LIKASELLSISFNESEAKIRDIFDKTRQSTPCMLFFAELELFSKTKTKLMESFFNVLFVKARDGIGGFGTDANDRIVNQIVTEMDCTNGKKDIFFLGATTQPANVNQAFLQIGISS
jgi:SpoVK/Ycf46/Vps4 family AAA+-type ATPase